MPEGDSIHRLAAVFRGIATDKPLIASSPQGRFAKGAALINHQYLVRSEAVGKHLFLGFAPSPDINEQSLTDISTPLPAGRISDVDILWLHIHLGLYGYWRFSGAETFPVLNFWGSPGSAHVPARVHIEGDPASWQVPEPIGQVRLRLQFPYGVADVAGPNTCELIDAEETQAIINRLGPDPLRIDIDGMDESRREFMTRVRASARPVAVLVMDQSVVAGPGNIYRAECLFRTGISPLRKGKNISVQRLSKLWDDLCNQMRRGLDLGRIVTIEDEDIPDPVPEDDIAVKRHYVYQRTDQPCLFCGAIIREKILAGRKLFWCPTCQAR